MADIRRRALVAALVGVLGASVGIAGAGHVYLRRWRRAAAWFTLVVGTLVALVFAFADPASMSASMAYVSGLPTEVTGPVFALLFLSTVDAYYVATRSHRADSGPRCPRCGGQLDLQMTFCPWCAAELNSRPLDVETVRLKEIDGAEPK